MKIQKKSLQDSWTKEQKEKLAKALTFTYKMQNTYKEPLDLEDRIAGWKFVLEELYSMDQVLYGLKKFLIDNKVMPVPCDINEILNPTKPEITKVQYMEAIKKHERNGFQQFSYESGIIQAYEAQEGDKQTEHKEYTNELTKIAGDAVKRIT